MTWLNRQCCSSTLYPTVGLTCEWCSQASGLKSVSPMCIWIFLPLGVGDLARPMVPGVYSRLCSPGGAGHCIGVVWLPENHHSSSDTHQGDPGCLLSPASAKEQFCLVGVATLGGSVLGYSHHLYSHPFPLQGNLLLTGDKDQLVMLLDQINSTFVRSNPSVLQGLLRIIPYLSFGEVEKMQILVERFKPYCSFEK
jgi:hypothetical protein